MTKPKAPDDDDALEELPPLDDDDGAPDEGYDDPLDELEVGADDEGSPDLALDEGIDELAPGDDVDDETDADLGEDEIDEDAHALTREDVEAPGIGEEHFGIGEAPALGHDDSGAEGMTDGEGAQGELPALDGDGDDGDGPTEIVRLPPLRRAPLPPWQDAAWDRVVDAEGTPPLFADARAPKTNDAGLVIAVATRPSRLLVSRDGGAVWSTRAIVLSDGEPLELADPRLALADEAVAIVDPAVGVLVARGLEAPFVLAEGCAGATAAAFLGPDIDAPLVVALSGDAGEPSYLARVHDGGEAALIAEVGAVGDSAVDALAWDGASALLWVSTPSGPQAFRAKR